MVALEKQFFLRTIAIGLIAGILSGLFGVGGGFVMVPLFVLWLHIEQKNAHATSLVAIIFVAVAATVGYISSHNVNWNFAGLIFFGGIIGTFIGVRIFNNISQTLLRNIFSFVLIAVAVRLLWSSTPHQLFTGLFADLVLVVIGILSGTLSGLLGIGGGIIIVPALIMCSGVQPEVARGTSLIVIIGTAVLGSFLHNRSGHINWKVGVVTGLAGIPAAIIGTHFGTLTSNRVIMPLFSMLLLLVVGQLFVSNRGQ
jgi:hypothetical protein